MAQDVRSWICRSRRRPCTRTPRMRAVSTSVLSWRRSCRSSWGGAQSRMRHFSGSTNGLGGAVLHDVTSPSNSAGPASCNRNQPRAVAVRPRLEADCVLGGSWWRLWVARQLIRWWPWGRFGARRRGANGWWPWGSFGATREGRRFRGSCWRLSCRWNVRVPVRPFGSAPASIRWLGWRSIKRLYVRIFFLFWSVPAAGPWTAWSRFRSRIALAPHLL